MPDCHEAQLHPPDTSQGIPSVKSLTSLTRKDSATTMSVTLRDIFHIFRFISKSYSKHMNPNKSLHRFLLQGQKNRPRRFTAGILQKASTTFLMLSKLYQHQQQPSTILRKKDGVNELSVGNEESTPSWTFKKRF